MSQFPLVTIGVPNYNYANYIEEALNSATQQTYPNIEIIIVDDCSTDNSVEIIEKWITTHNGYPKINFIKNKTNVGLTKVCNQILQNAKGKYFQTLDADDILLPEKIYTQVQAIEKKINAALAYSNIMLINENGEIINNDYLNHIRYNENNMPQGNVFEALFAFNFIPIPLINTEMARNVGGFDETIQVHDYYLWLKLSEKYDVIYIPGKTALYRIHGSSMSNSLRTNPKSVENVLRIKYRYYAQVNEQIKKIIRKNIYNSVVYLYKYKNPSAKKWLRINAKLNPGVKSIGYYIAFLLHIPYTFFDKLKSIT